MLGLLLYVAAITSPAVPAPSITPVISAPVVVAPAVSYPAVPAPNNDATMATTMPKLEAQEVMSPPADANLFIYRRSAFPLLALALIRVDDKKIAWIGNRTYTALHIPSGSHEIKASLSPIMAGFWLLLKHQGIGLEFSDSKKYYFQVSSEFQGFSYLTNFTLVDSETAAQDIKSCCKFKPPMPPSK